MERTARYVRTLFGNLVYALDRNAGNPKEAIRKEGFTITPGEGRDVFHAEAGGVTFNVYNYSSSYTWHADYGFRTGPDNRYIRIHDIGKSAEALASARITVPDTFPASRTEETLKTIARIKASILETERLVTGFGKWGCMGDTLRSRGYRVTYDGSSVCNFIKDGIIYAAHSADRPGWRLEDYYRAYFPDNVPSNRFSLEPDGHFMRLEENFETIFGDKLTSLGRYRTELERLKDGSLKFDRFRVRRYAARELSTLETFDDFEEAKRFALETARRLAAETHPSLRRYAVTDPRDCGDDYDYLAMYVYYQYGDSKQLVFVQGE